MTDQNQTLAPQQNQADIMQTAFGQAPQQQETASTVLAAQGKAAIEARYIMAMRNPRSVEQVRTDILHECKRPRFAEAALYRKPVAKGIEGLSIRFVEAAMQIMGNCLSEAVTIYDDETRRIIDVRVTDFEKNISHQKQITVTKTIELRNPKPDRVVIRRRQNSRGQSLSVVVATDDELLNKEAALVSKAVRTCGLRMIPGGLQDEAEEQIRRTLNDAAAKDPDLERRRLIDAFANLNVTPKDLSEYLGYPIEKITAKDVVELRSVGMAIRDEQTSWQEVIEHRREERGDDEKKEATEEEKATTESKGAAAVRDKLKRKKGTPDDKGA